MALHQEIQLREIKQKMARYCAYRERCSSEAIEKLVSLGCQPNQVEAVMQFLREENFLDDHRFGLSFARGKFNLNHWGKLKIKYALSQKKINPQIIQEALEDIPTENYRDKAEKLIMQKWKSTADENAYIKKNKVAQSIIRKGFEADLVWSIIEALE